MPKGVYERPPMAERFWSKVDKGDGKGCWLWTASVFQHGLPYGQFQFEVRPQLAHRVAWLLTYGRWPRRALAHTCDVPRCVRPDHLFEATSLENNRDMIAKGRHPTNRLTDAQAREIRERVALGPRGTRRRLAQEFGVTEAAISLIVSRKRRSQA